MKTQVDFNLKSVSNANAIEEAQKWKDIGWEVMVTGFGLSSAFVNASRYEEISSDEEFCIVDALTQAEINLMKAPDWIKAQRKPDNKEIADKIEHKAQIITELEATGWEKRGQPYKSHPFPSDINMRQVMVRKIRK